jgi:hypothetical protein
MHIPIILAHGALGGWDELIFLGIAAIFLAMMGISWVRSRNNMSPVNQTADASTPDSPEGDTPDHFHLE